MMITELVVVVPIVIIVYYFNQICFNCTYPLLLVSWCHRASSYYFLSIQIFSAPPTAAITT